MVKTYKFSTISDALRAARAASEIMVHEARGRGLRAEWLRPETYITGYHGGDRLAAETRGFTVDPSINLRLQFQVLNRKPRGGK